MSLASHLRRLLGLFALAVVLLGWLAYHTDVVFADGLRYIRQAQKIDAGDLEGGLLRAIDHPLYPASVAGARHLVGGDGPVTWQRAAQAASILAALLLVLPLYLIGVELIGPRAAWLGVGFAFVAPVTTHVFADGLSESTFLLGWCWGLWGAVKFLKRGSFGWLVPAILGGLAAYLTRPEGLLLPVALVASLALMPLLPSTRMHWPRWFAAVGLLVVLPALVVGPYAWNKGGLGSKPAIARILGTMPAANADAIERGRVVEGIPSPVKTYAVAAKAAFEAVRNTATVPLLALAAVGLVAAWKVPAPRVRLFLAILAAGTLFALVRLHATSGYCTPRHTLAISILLFPLAASGFAALMDRVRIPGRWLGLEDERMVLGPAAWGILLIGFTAWTAQSTLTPLNHQFHGYRAAAGFLTAHVPGDARVVDYSGWTLYYADRPGYTFRQIEEMKADPSVRWVVARDAHLVGPWGYSQLLRELTDGLEPVARFPESAEKGVARVLVFDRAPILAARQAAETATTVK